MGSMNISIKKEAYDLLSSLKGKDKSFSDVIIEIVNERKKGSSKDIMKFAGILKESKTDWNKIKKEIYDSRKRSSVREKKIEGMMK